MAAGFRRNAKSMAGRRIKPTSRVRVMLSQSLNLAFDKVTDELIEEERAVRLMMASGHGEVELQTGVARMRQGCNEAHEILDELHEYVDADDFDVYQDRLARVEHDCVEAEKDVCEFFDSRREPGDRKDPGAKLDRETMQEVLMRSRALEEEIKSIERKLVTTMGGAPPQAPPKPPRAPKASTPRDPNPPTLTTQGFNQSSAPSAIQPHADATAVALDRLAAVLESKQPSKDSHGGGRLPKIEPDVFKGDLISFPAWWNAFETMVESRARTESEKLFYLSKFTSGPAHECIKGFLSLYGDEDSYRRARNVIVNRYGNRLKIAEAFKAKLNKWSAVKDGAGAALQEYADFLWQCHSAMDSLDYLTNLNCREENLKMSSKLPKQVGERWDRVVDSAVFGDDYEDCTEEAGGLVGRFPSFTEFCKFVSREARIMIGTCTRSHTESAAPKKKAAGFATEAKEKKGGKQGEPPAFCAYCKGSHFLYQCKDFLGKNVEFKKEYAISKALCFGCLRSNHMYRNCRIRNPEIMRDHVQPPAQKATSLHIDTDDKGAHSAMIVPVWCYNDENPEMRILVYAMLDSMSSGCFMSEDLASRLQLEPEQVSVELTTLGSRRSVSCGAVQGLRVKGENGSESIGLPRCYTRRRIPGNYDYIPSPDLVAKWPHLREISGFLSEPCREISFGLLLGFNCSSALCVEDYRRSERHHPFAQKTVLGWTVTGCLEQRATPDRRAWSFPTTVKEVNVEEIRRVFDSDFQYGDGDERKLSLDDAKFDAIMDAGLVMDDDSHFQVPLPFREVPVDLPDSRPMAFQRLMTVKRKMKRDGAFCSQYAEFMNAVVDSGQAQRVLLPDQVPAGQSWYWCHHSVVHPRKPGKMRGVWDGRAQVKGVSINSHLLTGPDQMNNLVGVLTRFRREKVAIACDIEGMFLQVRVAPEHRRYLRFLWFEGGDPDAAVVEYELKVLPFGAASSPASAGRALKETAARFEDQFGVDAARFLRDHFYMDNGLGSVPDDDEALALITNSRGMCAAGGFNLRKFACSSAAVMDRIPADWRAPALQDICLQQGTMPNERVLGLLLSLSRDVFMYVVQALSRSDTRRGYLSALSSLFDPLGLVSPALLPGRLILQRLCASKFGWDDPVADDIREEWQLWYSQLESLNGLEIQRCFRRTVELPLTRQELHIFSDASDVGYGACCYLLLGDAQGHVDTSLVFAKSRVAPAKATTIPRLELQAAVLGVKIGRFVAEELQYPALTSHYYTDSTVVLGYIGNESKRFHVYVANRSQYIRSHTRREQWRHVKTDRNPADVASRGTGGDNLLYDRLWWHGPEELFQTMSSSLPDCVEVSDDDPEVRRAVQSLAVELHEEPSGAAEQLLGRFSSWKKCVRVGAKCIKFVTLLRQRSQGTMGPTPTDVTFVDLAVQWLVRATQSRAFADELRVLSPETTDELSPGRNDRRERLRAKSNLYRLDVYVDARGLLRVGGRLRLSHWPRGMVHPLVLPAGGRLTELVVDYHHQETQHMGTVTTLNALRQAGYWIIGGRSSISGRVSRCVVCRRKRGSTVQQRMADLPLDRLTTEPPFTHVAADLFGPMSIKRARSTEKWWVCVFVCMASRAVHLEPVSSLDTSGFIQAYRRFVARRGPVRSLRCDRGTNFVGASNEQAAALRDLPQDEVADELQKRSCDLIPFEFNYPKASHMAGSWERMIRSVRSAFWVTIRTFGDSLHLEVFQTMIAEAESLVNSRPLTVVDMVDDTTPCAITPSQLLTMKSQILAPPPGDFGPEERYAKKRWRLTQHLAEQFWRRWVREYALSQQKRQKWQPRHENLMIGDVVVVLDDALPRGRWPLARVSDVAPGEDGLVRKITVRTATSELMRPVHKVILILRPEGDVEE